MQSRGSGYTWEKAVDVWVLHLHAVGAEGGSMAVRHSRAVATGLAVERRHAAVQQCKEAKARRRRTSSILSWFSVGLDIVKLRMDWIGN